MITEPSRLTGVNEWREHALCRGFPQRWWFPEQGGQFRTAVWVCSMCPSRDACLQYAFDENKPEIKVEEFTDVIGRQFKQPREGLGLDNSSVAHMWRSIINPDRPL